MAQKGNIDTSERHRYRHQAQCLRVVTDGNRGLDSKLGLTNGKQRVGEIARRLGSSLTEGIEHMFPSGADGAQQECSHLGRVREPGQAPGGRCGTYGPASLGQGQPLTVGTGASVPTAPLGETGVSAGGSGLAGA